LTEICCLFENPSSLVIHAFLLLRSIPTVPE